MKKVNKFLALLLALALIGGVIPSASAANVTVAPGGTTTVSFAVDGAYGLDGTFSFSDSSFITGVSYSDNGAMDGGISGGSAFYYGSASSALVIYVTVQVSADAVDGQVCQITFTYETSDENGNMSDWKTSSCTVEVDIPNPEETTESTTAPTTGPTEPERPTETNPGEEDPTEPDDTEPEETEPAETEEPDETEPQAPTNPNTPDGPDSAGRVDYTELNRQIDLAENLNESQYTADSWAELEEALEDARDARYSDDQSWVDSCARALKNARDELVVMDSARLQNAIDTAEALLERDAASEKWQALRAALENAIAQAGSGDQSAVDEAHAMLSAAIQQVEQVLQEQDAQVKEVIKEVVVEVEPQGDYCNVASHHIWPIAFFVSLAVNMVCIALIVVYMIRRKKNQTDATPMVDYDIDDDFE